ncbi:tRNA (adenosine(37)-N6)-threonylcarbamoyltransferase complex dimerization subunit type 1 TsaB [Burkholderia vietnamiensis]|uniref:tRNA (adenosine(37)-N6)-threonylcarbamoyltransferase complex dimerization subunit type 1 TsaB n=1 Tax=Burkholderia vietnamiensis TaxID=60552 RepID=UPI000D782CA4|nr:tRNA (adenosine(37)-N6)-threonylcarbamoyltransferase complex dimerization subunit type 1 TsaB [Burkholderia vietnamiensis]GBH24440.1 tRNA (adenosine(37)-N6)-threonylcarbamoyltransferase complex dimerization subunit type 1 TsaB [Burkholderia vietnamiensis]
MLLAIDTSTEYCPVALLRSAPADAAVSSPQTWVRHELTGAVSSTRVLPAVQELFAESGLALADCDAIAFGAGPGSFTGLRTATGITQGLAFGRGLPVVPVGTLLVCAEHARLRAPGTTRVLAALDARMDEAYWADFAWDERAGDWQTLHPAALDAPGAVGVPDAPFTLAGNAAAAFGAQLPAAARAAVIDGEALPHALALAPVALRPFRAGRPVPAEHAAPEYVRDKVGQSTAERKAGRAAQAGGAKP